MLERQHNMGHLCLRKELTRNTYISNVFYFFFTFAMPITNAQYNLTLQMTMSIPITMLSKVATSKHTIILIKVREINSFFLQPKIVPFQVLGGTLSGSKSLIDIPSILQNNIQIFNYLMMSDLLMVVHLYDLQMSFQMMITSI